MLASSLAFGVKIGFFGGDLLKLTKEDLPALKPTYFISVPRLFNKIFGVIQGNIKAATGCKGWLVNRAVNAKMANLKSSNTVVNGCWDKIVFKKMKQIMGGNVKMMITGSAPIAGDVLDFLKICFCCQIAQGFGMTETSAGSFVQFHNDYSSGTCGGPVANVKFKLRSIHEMGYDATTKPPRGELMVAGSSIMKGYFRNPEKTKEMMPDGYWLLTGDVAEIQENGSVKIIDRAKNIFKLSQGEYIAPEKLENSYIQSEWIDQVWIHGDSLHDFCIMFAVLNPQKVKDKWGDSPELKS
jgi:long-chain acyl-CoA synthetase